MNLFCRECRGVSPHSIMAREPFSIRGGVQPHVPLLCVCDVCGADYLTFTQRFAFTTGNQDGEHYAKILGRNRLLPGDWLYVKGNRRPGKIKSMFHTDKEDIIDINYGDGPEEKIIRKYDEAEDSAPAYGYRLLPAQCAETLIGDPVYHVLRDKCGIAVGIVKDGDKDKLAVLLEDGTLLFITLPESAQTVPGGLLADAVQKKLDERFPETRTLLHIKVNEGAVFLQGSLPNYPLRRNVLQMVEGIPGVSGTVDFLTVNPRMKVPDEDLQEAALRILEDPSNAVFNYSLSVKNGILQVNGFYIHEGVYAEMARKFSELEGLCDLILLLEQIPPETATMHQLAISVSMTLRENPKMKDSAVRVSALDDALILEGRVVSVLQKSIAAFLAKNSTKKIKLVNKLRVIHS